MIQTFYDRDTERLFHREPVRSFPAELQRAMSRKLVLVDAAEQLEDLRVPPGNRLEKLKGDRAGQHSIRVLAPRLKNKFESSTALATHADAVKRSIVCSLRDLLPESGVTA